MQSERLIEKLNNKLAFVRKSALKELKKRERFDHSLIPNQNLHEVNMNIHTNYSFSPYSPTLASYMAYKSGIKIASACDFGTICATSEFKNACSYLNISTLSAFEVTLVSKQRGEGIYSFYGINSNAESAFLPMLEDFRKACYMRVSKVCEKINLKLKKFDLIVDFEKEVCKKVNTANGATLTLKHLYMATSEKIIEKFAKGKAIADFLRNTLCLDIEEGSYNLLCDANNPFYVYDLISALRRNFNSVESGVTPPALDDYLSVALKNSCIVAYEYEAPNNWLKNQAESEKTIADFEMALKSLKQEGINAVTISNNNLGEKIVEEFIKKAQQNEMLVIFNKRTEYPRDHFESPAPESSKAYLEKCAYAMLGNYLSTLTNVDDGLFTQKTLSKVSSFEQRLNIYYQIGKTQL